MAEFLDVYDANRNLIGAADRKVVHMFGLWHRTIHCWIVWNGKMVFQRRSRNLDNNPGKLYSTASGHVLAGETLEAAFGREIVQEIGVQPKNPKPLAEGVWVGDIKKLDGTFLFDRVFYSMYYAIHGEKLEDIKFSDGEVDSVVAIDLDEFIKFARAPKGEIGGIEWNGKELINVKLTHDDFLLNPSETIFSKYGQTAEKIKMDLS